MQNAVPLPRGVAHLLLVAWLSATAVGAGLAFKVPQADFLLYGAAASAIVTLPMLARSYDLLSPWSMLAFVVYLGCGVRGGAIAARDAADPLVDGLFLLRQPVESFAWPSIVFLIGLSLMTVGYGWTLRRRGPQEERAPVASYRFGRQADLVVCALAGVGLVTFYLFVQRTGGFDAAILSAKRTTIPGLDLTGYEGGHGTLRSLNRAASVALWLQVARYAASGTRVRALSGRGVWLGMLGMNAALLPIYSSTRAQVVYTLLTALVVHACIRRVRVRTLAAVGVAVLTIIAALTFLRESSQGENQSVRPAVVGQALTSALVMNRNFTEIPKTAHIMRAIPNKIEHTYGSTVYNYLLAPVPRTIWPSKPLISPGPVIGVRVYGTLRTGVPPGFIAEMYWAFALPGVLVGAYFLGWLLSRLHRYFLPRRNSVPGALLYSVAVFSFGANTMSGSLGYAALSSIVMAVTVWGALLLAQGSGPKPAAGAPRRFTGVRSRLG